MVDLRQRHDPTPQKQTDLDLMVILMAADGDGGSSVRVRCICQPTARSYGQCEIKAIPIVDKVWVSVVRIVTNICK